MKKLKLYSEFVYITALVLMALSVAMTAQADFGVSMIVAPAYILSLKFSALTFGQCEYIVQTLLFIIFCIAMRRVRPVYFASFAAALIYGWVLDLWRGLVPGLNPALTAPGSMAMPARLLLFALGMTLTSLTVAMMFRAYIYPQVYDFFVKGICERYGLNRNRFKICFDFTCLAIAAAMSLGFFRGFNGIGIGTLVMTIFNGMLIGLFGKLLDRYFEFVPLFPKLEALMSLEN